MKKNLKNTFKKNLWQIGALFLDKKFAWNRNSKVGKREFSFFLSERSRVMCLLWYLNYAVSSNIHAQVCCSCWAKPSRDVEKFFQEIAVLVSRMAMLSLFSILCTTCSPQQTKPELAQNHLYTFTGLDQSIFAHRYFRACIIFPIYGTHLVYL